MLIQKINNVVRSLLKEEITDHIQEVLKLSFSKIKNNDNWKEESDKLQFTFTFSGYERTIQVVGQLCMALAHFHGGYELNRIGNSDTVEIYSKGYYTYIGA